MRDNDYHFSLSDLYLSYRKAKAEAFYENTHFHALSFAQYEMELDRNLRNLHERLREPGASWAQDAEWMGGYSYAPKSVEPPDVSEIERVFYRFLDPMEEWERQWTDAGKARLKANFRLVITPSVDFQIVSALWILKVGHKYDSILDSNLSYANRVRRGGENEGAESGIQRSINTDCVGLFAPYFSAYSQWRENGLRAMRDALESDQRIVVVTMDLQRFYHRVSPKFLIRGKFLAAAGLDLTKEERKFTGLLVEAIQNWYAATPDAKDRPEGAIPVGLSASKIIANVLLAELDKKIRDKVRPAYYGRYVDDIFLVVRLKESPLSGDDVMHRLADQIPGILKFKSNIVGEERAGLRVSFDYARDSELLFTGSKQKVFNLSGQHGLDLVKQVSEQIRKHSSEHRLLPLLPTSSEEMSSRALLAQPSAALEADALRKADAISVRRLGLALLLRDVEAYARDLRPKAWRDRRYAFYGLVQRHVMTPTGFFDFFSYIHRVFGLMVACGDFEEARSMIGRLMRVVELLDRTTTAGGEDSARSRACRRFYGQALLQVALQSSTVAGFPWKRASQFRGVLRMLKKLDESVVIPSSLQTMKDLSNRLLFTDWGRRSYRDYWLHGGPRSLQNPPVPSSMLVRRVLHGVRQFRKSAGLRIPYWPGIVFPTRPLSLGEITLAAPRLLRDEKSLRSMVFAFRGARTRHWDGISEVASPDPLSPLEIIVQAPTDSDIRVAVPSLLTTDDEWRAALDNRPMLGIDRYERIIGITNAMMRQYPQPHYIAFPELSIPNAWATTIAHKLATRGISMLAGIEYRITPDGVRNDALISLCTRWPWYASALNFRQPKTCPSHEEKALLLDAGGKSLYKPRGEEVDLPVYVHGDFCFGVLICSDLTTISHRTRFQGALDALFVLEWNKDLESFGSLIEAAAQDLHGYIVQVNNRQFGDSRVRVPRRKDYERDAVRVKGGLSDYFVTAKLDVTGLRRAQSKTQGDPKSNFKPTPIGYRMSERRRKTA